MAARSFSKVTAAAVAAERAAIAGYLRGKAATVRERVDERLLSEDTAARLAPILAATADEIEQGLHESEGGGG